jgi:hypothetical protein
MTGVVCVQVLSYGVGFSGGPVEGETSLMTWMRVAGIVGGLAVASAGCGSDDDSPGNGGGDGVGAIVSGLPATKPVNTLTTSEVTQLCMAVVDSSKSSSVREGTCKALGVLRATLEAGFMLANTDAELRLSCATGYEECMKDMEGGSCEAAPASCTITVAEFEKCASDQNAAIIALGAAVPACATLTRAALSTAPSVTALEEPASCKALAPRCPGLVEEPELD